MWRKALRIFKIFAFFALIGFSSAGIFPEPLNMPSMPSTHVITSPEFPSISAPTLGSGFYVPGNSFYNQKKNSEQPESSSVQVKSEKQPEKSVSKNQAANNISSKDIQSLKNSGFLTGIYNLTNSNSPGDLELNSLLQTLNGIKNSPYQNLEKSLASIAESKTFSPKILRFTINGKNILSSCKNICFSTPENDGTFLLTADRKFQSQKENYDETFYFLFKKNTDNVSEVGYNVEPKVFQNQANSNSELYKMNSLKNLSAKKTGNLVYLQHTSENLSVDLLIDLGIA